MTAAIRLGPLGGLREVPLVQRGVSVQASRSEASFVTLGGRRAIQRSARAARDWAMSLGQWRTSADVAYLAACADGSIPGPLYLHTQDAALSNLFPSDVAAPCRMGTTALGSVAGTVPVGMAQGAVPMSGVVQQAAVGAWSPIIPVRQVPHALSAWASAAGAAVEWRTVTAAGLPVASGTVSAAAVSGGFRGAVTLTPGATVAGVQVRLAAGSRTVGGLRLAEGVQRSDGPVVATNLATNPVSRVAAFGLLQGGSGGTSERSTTWFRRGPASTLLTRGSTYTYAQAAPPSVHPASGTTVHFGAWVMVPAGTPATGINVSSRGTVEFSALGFSLTPGVPTWVSRSVTTTAAGQSAGFDVGWEPGLGAAGWQVYVSDVQMSTAPLDPEGGFDGEYSPDPALLPSWTGAANASPSVLKTIPADAVTETWLPGVGVPQVVVSDPQQTLQLATTTDVRSDYTVTIREVG